MILQDPFISFIYCKENFEEDIQLWKQNHRDRGITDDVTLFPTIPILTSNWSRVIFSDIKEIKE